MNENLVQVEDSSYVRDIHSKAILNTDIVGLQNYYVQRDLYKKEQAEKLQASNRLTQLEEDMSEIKTMLRQLVSKEMSNGS
jgi:cell shape-determining protein MreC